jgi:hypothetical protein
MLLRNIEMKIFLMSLLDLMDFRPTADCGLVYAVMAAANLNPFRIRSITPLSDLVE